ncbi:MAG: hypothetical protein ACT4OO_07945 [Nitrospiraceae bacterium]
MSDVKKSAHEIIALQLKELDAILNQTMQDLNTVGGSERVGKWKAKTTALIAQYVGQQESQAFAAKHPGPSFTNDLFEEFTDEVDFYKTTLTAFAKTWPIAGTGAAGSD